MPEAALLISHEGRGTTARVLDEVRSLDQTVTTLDQAKEAFLTREFGFLKSTFSQQVSQVQSMSQRMDNDVIRRLAGACPDDPDANACAR